MLKCNYSVGGNEIKSILLHSIVGWVATQLTRIQLIILITLKGWLQNCTLPVILSPSLVLGVASFSWNTSLLHRLKVPGNVNNCQLKPRLSNHRKRIMTLRAVAALSSVLNTLIPNQSPTSLWGCVLWADGMNYMTVLKLCCGW